MSSLRALLLLSPLVTLDATVFLLQKSASRHADAANYFPSLARRPELWIALALAGLQLAIWLRVLSKLNLGSAYGLTSLAYPLTMIAASLIFRERYDLNVWAGALLITLGAVLLSSNPAEETHADGKAGGDVQHGGTHG